MDRIVKAVMNKERLEITKAVATTDTGMAAIVSPEFSDDIYSLVAQYGSWRNLNVRRMSAKQEKLIVENSAPEAYIVAENATIPETALDLGTVTLSAVKFATLLGVSGEALQDISQLGPYIIDTFARAVAAKIDDCIFNGDGSSNYGSITGIFNAATTVQAASATTFGAITYADILKLISGVDSSVLSRNPVFYAHQSIMPLLAGLVDANGRPMFQQGLEAPNVGSVTKLFGYPLILTSAAPYTSGANKPLLAFGDPNAYVVGLRQDYEFAFSDDFKFSQYQRVYRGVARATGGLRMAGAMAVLKTHA